MAERLRNRSSFPPASSLNLPQARIPDPVRKLFQGRRKNFGKWTRTTIPVCIEASILA